MESRLEPSVVGQSRAEQPGVYLVTLISKERPRRAVWDAQEPLPLNHPATFWLEESEAGVAIVSSDEAKSPIPVPPEVLHLGLSVSVNDDLIVQVRTMKRPKAAYLPRATPLALLPGAVTEAPELFCSTGYGDVFLEFKPISGATVVRLEDQRVARFSRVANGVQIEALAPGLVYAVNSDHDEKALEHALTVGQSRVVEVRDSAALRVSVGSHWWRLHMGVVPAIPEIEKTALVDKDREALLFFRTAKGLVASFALFALLTWVNVIPTPKPPEPPVEETPPAVVKIRKNPLPLAVKKPEPKELEKTPPPPAPPKEKKSAVAKKPEKKPQKMPDKKADTKLAKQAPKPKIPPVAQKAAPAPKGVVKAPPAPAPKGRMAAAPSTGPKPPAPTAAQVQAAQNQARLSKSLGFLSSAPKGITARNLAPSTIQNPYTKYQAANAASAAVAQAGGGYLSKVASQFGGKGVAAINTRNARGISGGAGVTGGFGTGGKGKGLNDVQGRVSLSALYDPNAGDGMGSALGGGGLTMSGEGSIAESVLMKVLEKHMQKFQYCYEKSLLTNPSIAGTLVLQWTIQPGGQATAVKVVRSQLNEAKLHQCVTQELARIPFPGPKGGSVTVKFPFAFSSSAL